MEVNLDKLNKRWRGRFALVPRRQQAPVVRTRVFNYVGREKPTRFIGWCLKLTMVCGVEHAHVRVLHLHAAPGGAHSTVKVKQV
jgi:hypothetical protein